jgi:predicted P-loop ATPase
LSSSCRRRCKRHPRRCTFFATTNDDLFLQTPGKHRRFWPVHRTSSAAAFSPEKARELWIEAALCYLSGESWHLSEDEQELHAVEVAKCRFADSWEDSLGAKLSEVSRVRLADAIKLCDPDCRVTQADLHRCARALRAMGWTPKHTRTGTQWVSP